MSGAALTLTLPMPPNMANARMHWRVKQNAKTEYWARLNLLHAAGVIARAPYPTPERAEIHVRMHVGGQMDHDNAMARLKWLLDWLVGNRYLRDDSPRHLEWAGFPEQVVKKDGNYRCDLTITPL
jgi:hypothetical protein